MLLEYSREISQKTVGEKVTKAFNDIFSTNLSVDKVYDILEAADPTPKKEYVQHIIRWILAGPKNEIVFSFLTNESLFIETFQKDLQLYDTAKKKNLLKGTEKDITTFKTMFSFFNFVEKEVAERLEKKEREKQKETQEINDATELVYESENYRCIWIKNKAAACYYGKDILWCTASTKSDNMFDKYNKDYYIIVFQPKKPNLMKFQIGIPKDEDYSLPDLINHKHIKGTGNILIFDRNDHSRIDSYNMMIDENIFEEVMECLKKFQPNMYETFIKELEDYTKITSHFENLINDILEHFEYRSYDLVKRLENYIEIHGTEKIKELLKKIIKTRLSEHIREFDFRNKKDQVLFYLYLIFNCGLMGDTKSLLKITENVKRIVSSYKFGVVFQESVLFLKSKIEKDVVFGFLVLIFRGVIPTHEEDSLKMIIFRKNSMGFYNLEKCELFNKDRLNGFILYLNNNKSLFESIQTNLVFHNIFEQKNKIVINSPQITLSEIANLLKTNKKLIQESYLPPISLVIEVNGNTINFDTTTPYFQEIVEAIEKYVEINI